ncbi:hypothetical protein ATANTOWER_032391 [Ataeniobius toweri]|uniref:Uncharacterized protein n=1 Tax=Ataeniobius toweri TaxID=208326 RepID=A0ABU7AC58_9TELE|nr:hypothetical protein [Ataeniobius toweri]
MCLLNLLLGFPLITPAVSVVLETSMYDDPRTSNPMCCPGCIHVFSSFCKLLTFKLSNIKLTTQLEADSHLLQSKYLGISQMGQMHCFNYPAVLILGTLENKSRVTELLMLLNVLSIFSIYFYDTATVFFFFFYCLIFFIFLFMI